MQLSTKTLTSMNAKSFFVAFIIALGVISFAVTGIGFNMGSSLDANVAARVGSQTVSMRNFSEVYSQLNSQSGEGLDDARRAANAQQAMNQLIQEKLFIEEAARIGWRANDLQVANWIREKIPTFQNETTKKFDKVLYQKFIKSGQMSELDLYERGRESLAQEHFYNLLQLNHYTPSELIKERMQRDAIEFDMEMVELKPSEEAVNLAASAEAAKFAADAANEKTLKDAYEASKDEFQQKAAQKVSSVLISYKGAQRAEGAALSRSEDDAKKLADETHAKLVGGADFAATTNAINDDGKAKSANGDLGFVDDKVIDPDSYKAVEALSNTAALSPVVKTPFGFRIFKWTGTRPAVNKSFDDVKMQLAQREVGQNARLKLTQEIKTAVSTAIAENNTQKLNEALAQYKLSWKKVSKPISANNRYIEEIGFTDAVLAKAFQLKNPGDMTKEPVDVSNRSMIFKLLARRDGPAVDDKKIAETRRMDDMRAVQSLAGTVQRKLMEVYESNKQIKRNSALMAAK